MKTIDERATEWSENNNNLYGIDAPTLMEASYHQGATDQRAIDIEKACEWLKGELYETTATDIRYQTGVTSHTWWTVEEFVNAFRNAMDNE